MIKGVGFEMIIVFPIRYVNVAGFAGTSQLLYVS